MCSLRCEPRQAGRKRAARLQSSRRDLPPQMENLVTMRIIRAALAQAAYGEKPVRPAYALWGRGLTEMNTGEESIVLDWASSVAEALAGLQKAPQATSHGLGRKSAMGASSSNAVERPKPRIMDLCIGGGQPRRGTRPRRPGQSLAATVAKRTHSRRFGVQLPKQRAGAHCEAHA